MTGDFPVPIRTWNKTATELAELAHTKEEAIQLVMQSLTQTQYAPDTLPKGMTAIYCDFKKRTLAKSNKKSLKKNPQAFKYLELKFKNQKFP